MYDSSGGRAQVVERQTAVLCGQIAQVVEHQTADPWIAGSSLTSDEKCKNC